MPHSEQEVTARIAERLVNAAGEWRQITETDPLFRDSVRRMVGDLARGLVDPTRSWTPTLDDPEDDYAAFRDTALICVSVAAESTHGDEIDADVWAYLNEAWHAYQTVVGGNTRGDWLESLAGYERSRGAAPPDRADDALLLFGAPSELSRQDVLRAAHPFTMALCLARLHLEFEADVMTNETRYGSETEDTASGTIAALSAFSVMEDDSRAATGQSRIPADGRRALSRRASASMHSLADALLQSPGSRLSLYEDIARALRGQSVNDTVMIGRDYYDDLGELSDYCAEQSLAWTAVPGRGSDARCALAAAEHFNQAAYHVRKQGGLLSFGAIVPPPPDPYLDGLARVLHGAPPERVKAAKESWSDACITAAAALRGFAGRASRASNRDALLFCARAMARRGLGVATHSNRFAEYAYTPLM